MMKVVIPLRVESVSSEFRWSNDTGIVERAFGDDIHAAIECRPLFMHGFGEFFEEIQRRMIENGVNRIEAKRIKVIVGNPFQCIRDKEVPDFVTVSVIEIQRRAPRCFVAIRKVWSELREVISLRS